MLVELIALLAFAAPQEEIISEPASEADRADRVAYFDSLAKLSALRPCQQRFPAQAAAFAAAHADWKRRNAARIADGKKSVEGVAGSEAANEPFALDEAQAAIATVLGGLPEAQRLPWCEDHFPGAMAPAASFAKGVARLRDDDADNDAAGLEHIMAAAGQGHPHAEMLVSIMHLDGAPRFGWPRDVAQGLEYLERAAGHGLNHAQLALGMHYAQGDIVPRNPQLAEKWLTLGARQSDALMHASLADMFEKGDGVPRSLPKAFRLHAAAADMGHAWAALRAATMLLEGKAVPRDAAQAYYFALLAVRGGNQEAEATRDEASALLGAGERRSIEARVAAWTPRAPHPAASAPLLPAD